MKTVRPLEQQVTEQNKFIKMLTLTQAGYNH